MIQKSKSIESQILMALETIKCQECGSAEVTEFKAGSYVCGHCEAIFKRVNSFGLANELCECGAFATGHCRECDSPICNAHARRWEDRLLCTSCFARPYAEAEQARVNREKAEADREQAEAERKERQRQAVLAAIQRDADRIEALFIAVRFFHTEGGSKYANEEHIMSLLPDVFPEVSPDDRFIGNINSLDIGSWFVSRANEAHLKPDSTFVETWSQKRPMRGYVDQSTGPQLAWRLPGGSKVKGGDVSANLYGECDAYVLTDGRIVYYGWRQHVSSAELNGSGLLFMALQLELTLPGLLTFPACPSSV